MIKLSREQLNKIKDEIFKELESKLDQKKIRLDNIESADIDLIVQKVKATLPEVRLDSEEIIAGLLKNVIKTEQEKKVDFYRDEVFSPEIKIALSKQVLDQIELPKDGDKGDVGEKGEQGKDAPPVKLTERDKKEIAEFVDVTQLIKDRKQDLVELIKQLKNGKIKVKSGAGIDIKEIIKDINQALGTSDWQSGLPGDGTIEANLPYVNFTENYEGAVPDEAGVVRWNDNELSLDVNTGIGPVLQMGQEVYVLFYNDTGEDIENGTVLRPKSAVLVGEIVVPTPELAQANVFSSAEGTLALTTMFIPDGEIGLVTRFGRVRKLDTSMFSPGEAVFLSGTTPGGLVNVRPEFPNYDISMGGVLVSDDEDGEIFVTITKDIFDTTINFWNGVFRESFDFLVSSAGGVITGSLSPTNGHPDMTMMFSDGFTMLTTTPAATIVLTAGTDTNPQENFVYILKSTKVLTISTSDWPVAEHIKVATIALKTAATTLSDGVLKNQNWNDFIEDTSTFQGHLSHITEKLRQFEAQWKSGVQGSAAGFPSNVYVSTTAGVVYQLHKQEFISHSMPTDDIEVVNNFANSYTVTTNLNTQTLDALGNTLANYSFSFVVWGVQNKTGQISHLMCNLPVGHYAKNAPGNAVSDALNYSVYSIPKIFQGVGFLIARFTFVLEADGTTWSLYDTEDLRGKIPNTTAGGGAGGTGVTTWTGLTDTPSSFVASQIPRVNAGGTALDFTTLLPSGATQAAAGAAAGEFWRTASHATLPDNVVLQGV